MTNKVKHDNHLRKHEDRIMNSVELPLNQKLDDTTKLDTIKSETQVELEKYDLKIPEIRHNVKSEDAENESQKKSEKSAKKLSKISEKDEEDKLYEYESDEYAFNEVKSDQKSGLKLGYLKSTINKRFKSSESSEIR